MSHKRSVAHVLRAASRGFASQAEPLPAPRTTPRWYKDVNVIPNAIDGEYLVQLDRRTLRTPARHLLVLPSYPLALAVAAEWQWQDGKIRPFTMPIMSLAATAIDQPKPRPLVIETLCRFLHTDALTCKHDSQVVAQKQAQELDPVVRWASEEFGVAFQTGNSIFGVQQPPEVEDAFWQFLDDLSNWELAAVESLSGACKSVILGTALYKGHVTAKKGIELARLEENLQLEEWGYVEGGHDIDDADIKNHILSASIFARLLPPSTI